MLGMGRTASLGLAEVGVEVRGEGLAWLRQEGWGVGGECLKLEAYAASEQLVKRPDGLSRQGFQGRL